MKFLSNAYNNPNTNPKILTAGFLTLEHVLRKIHHCTFLARNYNNINSSSYPEAGQTN